MVPSDPGQGQSGIHQVIRYYKQYLPAYGVEFVENGSYDLLATHAGAMGAECDVAHNHGLYWSADYDASEWEYKANSQVIAALRNAKQITVPSQWVAQVLRRDMRINPHVVPHGIEWEQWQGGKPQGYVLYNKNRQGDVCDATPLSYLAAHAPSQKFITTFATADLSNVTVTGVLPHDKMALLVRGASVYFAPTKETFGIGILEAMAAGVPVLGYAHGGILDLVQHGVNGYLAQPGNEQDLLAGLAYCLQHRSVLGENGRGMAQAYTWDKVAAQVAEVYRLAMVEEPATVAIIIPSFNYGSRVGKAIESAVAQTYPLLTDIVIVDDGSTDGVDLSKFEALDKRIKVIRQANQGVAHARNNGIASVSTKYILCLDADDWLDPKYLIATVPSLEDDRTLGIAYAGLMLVGGDWEKPGRWPPDHSDFDKQLMGQNQVPTCCVFRRSVWERLGGYRQRYAPRGCGTEDAELWLRMGALGYKAEKVSRAPLFFYTLGGRTTGNEQYRETNWLDWHPYTVDGQHPFASVATPVHFSHPVRQYDNPVVSVVIPVGPGHEQHVIEALDSLDAQTLRQWEGIVVWDTGAAIPRSLTSAYPHIQWIVTKGKTGAGSARNVGAAAARAPFLVFLDADDWLLPPALEEMVAAYGETEAIIYGESYGLRAVDEQTAREYERHGELARYENGVATVHQPVADYNYELAIRQPYTDPPYFWCYINSLVPKAWHDEVGGFDEGLPAWEDWEYWIRQAKAGRSFVAIHTPLSVYCYDAGQRREIGKGIKQDLLQYLREKHEGVQIMPCSSCGKKVVRSAPPRTPIQQSAPQQIERMVESMSDSDFVMVEYSPARGGDHGVVGIAVFSNKTYPNMRKVAGGWVFDYGHRTKGDRFLVHIADQRALPDWYRLVQVPDAQRVIRVAPTPQPVTVTAPVPARLPTEPEPAPEVVEDKFDPQTLPGVSPSLAKAMLAAGFDTKQKILDGDLTKVKGIGAAKAQAIKESLTVAPDVARVLEELKAALGQK